MSDLAVRVRGLRKAYGEIEAVRGIDFDVRVGEIYALLGPNGAGKTTTVEVLEGHRQRTSGEVEVLGFDPGRNERAFKERVGIVLQETGLGDYLTAAETVAMFSGYYPRPRPVGEVLELVGLSEARGTPVRRLSGGQRRRLDVAVGLAGDPDLLFLDEPTTGFDPAARRGAWEMVLNLRRLGKTVLLTTHYMDEAQYLADRVAIIRRGEIVAEGAPADLVHAEAASLIRFRHDPAGGPLPPGLPGLALNDDGFATIETPEPTRVLHALTAWAAERGRELADLTVTRPSLEDVYLRLVSAGEEGGRRA
jgi:ABC-2 type transport system ATP-binding protein